MNHSPTDPQISAPQHPEDGEEFSAVVREEQIIEVTESDGEITVDEVIELEVYFREQRRVPLARAYRIRIDKLYYTVDVPTIIARDLLRLASKTPTEKYVLRQIIHGQPIKLELDEIVDLRTPGIEKFKTMLKTAQDGAF